MKNDQEHGNVRFDHAGHTFYGAAGGRRFTGMPVSAMMSGAQRAATDRATNAAVPSDSDVEDMRRFSEENRL